MITHPDERAVGVLPGRATRHNGGCSGEPTVHRYKSNSKPVKTQSDSDEKREDRPDGRGAKEEGALAKGGGG